MKLTCYGVRGSFPVVDPAFSTYGGDTTCFGIESEQGDRVLVDAGTGIYTAGKEANGRGGEPTWLLFTHYHLDHIAGLPSFSPLYEKSELKLLGPEIAGGTAQQWLERLLSNPYWPLASHDFPSTISWSSLKKKTPTIGGLYLSWCPLHHYEGSIAYRLDEPGSGQSLVIATDVEWAESTAHEKDALLTLCRKPSPATALIMDGHFLQEEYEAFRGWGHSTIQDCIHLAQTTGAKKTFITHHHPEKNDNQLAAIDKMLSEEKVSIRLARQGDRIELGSILNEEG